MCEWILPIHGNALMTKPNTSENYSALIQGSCWRNIYFYLNHNIYFFQNYIGILAITKKELSKPLQNQLFITD